LYTYVAKTDTQGRTASPLRAEDGGTRGEYENFEKDENFGNEENVQNSENMQNVGKVENLENLENYTKAENRKFSSFWNFS
jgi:hypothetical protein